jgi:hypothetical protein
LFFWNNFFKKDKKIDKEKKRLSKLMKQSGVMGNDLMQKEMVDASVSMSKNLSKDTSLVASTLLNACLSEHRKWEDSNVLETPTWCSPASRPRKMI